MCMPCMALFTRRKDWAGNKIPRRIGQAVGGQTALSGARGGKGAKVYRLELYTERKTYLSSRGGCVGLIDVRAGSLRTCSYLQITTRPRLSARGGVNHDSHRLHNS